jgi:FMN phosphatase YigB (HAD superfamily)
MLKAVVFDLFETLITESRTRPAGVSSLAPELGCERVAFRREWKTRRPAVTAGEVSFQQALADITATLDGHADGVTLQRFSDERVRVKAEPFVQIEAEVLTALDRLRRRRLRLGVISNCFAEDVTAWPRCVLAPRVDCTVFSFEAGLAKPDPEIYRAATLRLSVDPSETWFIGDGHEDELSGAEQAGLRAFKALWFLKRWPHFREESSTIKSIATIEDLVSLVDRAAS